MIVAFESHQGAVHIQVTTIGLDIAKNVFQVHGIDASEKVVVRKQLRRRQVLEFFKALPPCLVGMEACATAHYWARELTKLGHQVRLMPAKDVKAYVKRATLPFNCAEYYNSPKGRKTMRRRDFIAGSDDRGRNGTGAGTADWESLPYRIRSSLGPGCRSKSGEQGLARNPRHFRGAGTLSLCRRVQSPDRAENPATPRPLRW